MRKKTLLGIIISLILVGCGDSAFPELNDDGVALNTEEYIFDDNCNDVIFHEFEYNGRKYLEYGSIKGILKKKNIDKCVGYIVQGDNSKNVRVYTLAEDAENNFLIDYVVDSNELITPFVWRAEDTKEKDIDIPQYILPADCYSQIWN